MNAAVEFLPFSVVYKGNKSYELWMVGGPKNWQFACSKSGQMSDKAFENWFSGYFAPTVIIKVKPIVAFLYGHGRIWPITL